MSNATHTPGPWGCCYTSNHAHDYRLTKPNFDTLPVNAPSNDHSEQRANARLIAAAPDLLAALEWLRDEYCEGGALDGTEAERRILVAIAKAKGTAA